MANVSSWLRRRVPFLIAIGVIAAAFAIYYPYSQSAQMARAHRHLPAIERALQSDALFAGVRVSVGTIDNGCLVILGDLESAEDLAALKRLVASTSPPVPVRYVVRSRTGGSLAGPSESRRSSTRPGD